MGNGLVIKDKNKINESKKEIKKLTLDDLLRETDSKETKEFLMESKNATVTVEKPSYEVIEDTFKFENGKEGDAFLIYECIVNPNLKDERLHEKHKSFKPYEIVYEIFSFGEIKDLAKKLYEFAGLNSKVEEIKN